MDDSRSGVDQALDLDRRSQLSPKIMEAAERLIRVRPAQSAVAGANFMAGGIGPAHRRLDRERQAVEPDCQGNFETAKNDRFNLVERDLEAGDRQ